MQLKDAVEAVFGPGAFELIEQPQSMLLFEMSRAWFAVPVAHVVEVQRLPRVTRLPRGAEWLRGVANLRGNIVSVVELHWFLDTSVRTPSGVEFLLVVRSLDDGMTVGLVVDRVLGIRGIEARQEDTAAPSMPLTAGLIRQISQCDGRNVAVVDMQRFLSSPELRQFNTM